MQFPLKTSCPQLVFSVYIPAVVYREIEFWKII